MNFLRDFYSLSDEQHDKIKSELHGRYPDFYSPTCISLLRPIAQQLANIKYQDNKWVQQTKAVQNKQRLNINVSFSRKSDIQ